MFILVDHEVFKEQLSRAGSLSETIRKPGTYDLVACGELGFRGQIRSCGRKKRQFVKQRHAPKGDSLAQLEFTIQRITYTR
jgi:hypothetical protein